MDNVDGRRSFEAEKCKVCAEKATNNLNYGEIQDYISEYKR